MRRSNPALALSQILDRIPLRTGLGIRRTLPLLNPVALARSLWAHRQLIAQFAKRDVLIRYRGSYLGLAWSFLTPLFMLAVFTFVFSVVFQARWGEGQAQGNRLEFALILFSGLIIFNVFAECVTRAPGLILANANYVKKMVFPLEVFPVAVLGSALIHAAVSLLVLLVGLLLLLGVLHWTVVFVPLILIPLSLVCLGFGWFLASLGVYVRDMGQIVGVLVQALMFLSPIFYPVSAIPQWLRPVYWVNPLTVVIENMRAVILWGELPQWQPVGAVTAVTLGIALLGYAWFQRTRGGFADVV